MNNTLTAIDGVTVGHVTDTDTLTGCTVILLPPKTIGGIDQRGGAPGTRETDLLRPMHMVEAVNALVLSGGSAFGLAAADGVMQYLREQNIGFPTGSGVHVPIVPAAILYDLEVGKPHAPTANDGYEAAKNATTDPIQSGCLGVGTGCRVGALAGNAQATKGGLGSAAVYLPNGLIVAALFAVNAVGDILDENGQILAGLRHPKTGDWLGSLNAMTHLHANPPTSNTVIGTVITNAQLTKEHVNKVAQMAHDGLARAVHPAHTMYDGDTIFAFATGQVTADVNLVGAYAAEVVATAIRDGVRSATNMGGLQAIG